MTVKEQCLKIIDDKITLLYECEPSNDRSIALHWLYEVYYNINIKVEEPAAAHNYAVVLEHPEEMPVISKEQVEQFKEELNEAQYIIYDKFGMPKQEITFKKEGVIN